MSFVYLLKQIFLLFFWCLDLLHEGLYRNDLLQQFLGLDPPQRYDVEAQCPKIKQEAPKGRGSQGHC